MSVVAVKVNKNNIEIASDSIIVRGYSKRTDRNFHKLVKINDIIVGAVGDAEEASLFINFCELHNIKEPNETSILNFMVEFMTWKTGISEHYGLDNEYIIVYGGKVFSVNNLLVEEVTNYEAIGAGEDFATAALYLGHSAKEAVKVACDLCCWVAEPIIDYVIKR